MGKYERDWADDLGKKICHAFNTASNTTKAVQLAVDTIHDQFPSATQIEWIGDGDYGTVGDIAVYCDENIISAIELKSSRSNGKGTSANISQNFFGEWFDGGIGYSAWEKQDGIYEERYSIVEKLTGNRPKNQSQYVKACRELRDNDSLDDIVNLTNSKKSEYVQKINQIVHTDLPRMSNLLHILRQGRHQIKAIREALEDDVFSTPRILLIGQHLETDNPIWFWEEKFSKIDDEIVNVTLSDKGLEFSQKSGKTARFQVHWKNVAQGVQTPCFNVWY